MKYLAAALALSLGSVALAEQPDVFAPCVVRVAVANMHNSMAPTLADGQDVALAPAPFDGRLIHRVIEWRYLARKINVIHRVIEMHQCANGKWYAITQGDNNAAPDSIRVTEAEFRGVAVGVK